MKKIKAKRIAGDIPVASLIVGNGEGLITFKKLNKTIMKMGKKISPSTIIFFRVLIGAMVLLPLALMQNKIRIPRKYWHIVLIYTVAELIGPWYLITNPAIEVMTKLADRAYDLVIFRDNAEDLPDAIIEAYRILRSGGVFVIDNFFGGAKVNDPAQRDPKTIALRDAGKALKGDTEKWVTSLIPVGDGLLLATKL